MRGISAVSLFFSVMILASPLLGAQDVVVVDDAAETTSAPVFSPEQVFSPPGKDGEFYDKIRRKQARFDRKENERRRKFFQKIRTGRWESGEQQHRLAEFQQETIQRRARFAEKQQKKIEKHYRKLREG